MKGVEHINSHEAAKAGIGCFKIALLGFGIVISYIAIPFYAYAQYVALGSINYWSFVIPAITTIYFVRKLSKSGNTKLSFALSFILLFSILPMVAKSIGNKNIDLVVSYLLPIAWATSLVWYLIKSKKNSGSGSRAKNKIKIKHSDFVESFSLNNQVLIQNPYAGVFICGGAGSGKSKSNVEPIIKECGMKGFTGVVYDFKFPELACYVETAYQNSEINRYYLDFTNIDYSNRINPIAPSLMKSPSYAREFAYSILANLNKKMIKSPDFWTDNSLTYLSATFWFLRCEYPQYCTLPHAMSLALNPNFESLISLLRTNLQTADMVAPIAAALETGAQNQLAGVVSSLQVSLSKINTPEIYYLTSFSDFNLDLNNPENPGILTIGNDPTLSSTYSPVLGLILTSISKQLNQRDKLKSIFLVDEFPTLFIPGVEQLPATARSNKVATVLACQDIAQMVDMYGKEKSETILSNLGNQFYGRTTNPQTAERVSKMFGKSDKLMVSSNENFEGSWTGNSRKGSGLSYSYQERDLVRVQEVATLNTGEFFIMLSEGDIKQGKDYIPINPNFTKTTLPKTNRIGQEELDHTYMKIRNEANTLLNN